jgi:hypothetical protein
MGSRRAHEPYTKPPPQAWDGIATVQGARTLNKQCTAGRVTLAWAHAPHHQQPTVPLAMPLPPWLCGPAHSSLQLQAGTGHVYAAPQGKKPRTTATQSTLRHFPHPLLRALATATKRGICFQHHMHGHQRCATKALSITAAAAAAAAAGVRASGTASNDCYPSGCRVACCGCTCCCCCCCCCGKGAAAAAGGGVPPPVAYAPQRTVVMRRHGSSPHGR